MATKKQIEANRKNAQNSTGPQTPDGKSIVAQNALKHGLTAQKPLIPGEDPAHFAQFTDSMLAQFDPQGPLETVLANRIITLTWQLNRAPRIQAAAFNHLIGSSKEDNYLEERLGKTIARDFADSQVLEKLRAYESRIESNLYKTIDKLEIIQKKRTQIAPPQYLPPMQVCGHPENTPPQPDIPYQSANHQLPATNSFPQNKPNSQPETPPQMSSQAEKCEAKSSVSQSAIHEQQTMNPVPQNKPNLNKYLTLP